MTYLSGRARTRRKYLNMLLGAVAFGLFVYFWPQFKAVAYPLVEPLVRGYGGAKGIAQLMPENITTYFGSRSRLLHENKNLLLEVERLENENALLQSVTREQALLTGTQTSNRPAPLVLYPIAQDVTKLYSTLLLSKGYRDGMTKGELVYVRGRQPVCDIVEVYDKTSLCELFSRGGRMTEGVTSSSSVTLTLSGEGGGNFIAEVPKGTVVQIGEEVYLRSDPSFRLGTVVTIKEDEQSTGAKLYVRGAYNPVTSSVFYLDVRYAP